MATRDDGAQAGGWRLLIPWMILPIALAIITLVEWLRTRRVRAFLSRWSARPWTME